MLCGTPTPVDGATEAWAPRRSVLDGILIDAAADAGVDVRDRTTLVELLRSEGTVCGVRVRTRNGTVHDMHAPLVIGADGRHSAVVRLVGAPYVEHRPSLQATCFAYWSGLALDDIAISSREGRTTYAWPTNDDLTLIGVNWRVAEFAKVRRGPERHFLASLDTLAPELAAAVRSGRRESRWISTDSAPTFYRVSHGPGWALVGDAGYSIDPGTAQGISDAFRDALGLADAVHAGLDHPERLAAGLEAHYRHRGSTTRPMCELTYQLSALDAPPPDMVALFAALAGNQAGTDRFFGVLAGTIPVDEFFAPDHLATLLG
jgi:2-polyprenyl-6-methoxyphenol hydroxylase-like FAD-dependent oxidoreductase